jgi:hypothetical protein
MLSGSRFDPVWSAAVSCFNCWLRRYLSRDASLAGLVGDAAVGSERPLPSAALRGADGAAASRLAEAIESMAGRIGASHLLTHIEQTALLSAEQVGRYNRLRGYEK